MEKGMQFPAKRFLDDGFIRRYKNAGFRAAAVSLEQEDLAIPDWKGHIVQIRDSMDAAGISCIQTHLWYYNILRSSESIDDETDECIRRSVEATAMLGAKWGALHPRAGHSYGYDIKREFQDNTKAVEKLLDTAARCGAGIAVENIPIFPDCPQYKFFTSNPKDHIAFVDQFDPELVGICWDTGHANLMPYDQATVIRSLGDRLKIVHLQNNGQRLCDEHAVPSVGSIPWEHVMPAIASSAGWTGGILLEVHSCALRTEATYFAHCHDCACMLEELID